MTTLVVGVGNPDRGDDAVGWVVAGALDDCGLLGPGGDVVVRLSQGEPAGLVETWLGHDGPAVLVDATVSGLPPGTVTTFDATKAPIDQVTQTSSHGFGPSEAVALAAALGDLPESLVFVGIEAKSFEPGAPLTPEAAAGADQAVELIRSWIEGTGTPDVSRRS